MAKDPLIVNEQMCFALYATSRAITKKYAELLGELEVTYPQYLTLLVLWRNDGVSVNELAAALEMEGATMTPLVQRMEKAGLVDRIRSKEDNRRVEVRLTEKARTLRKKALKVPPALGCAIGVDDDLAKDIIGKMNDIRAHLT